MNGDIVDDIQELLDEIEKKAPHLKEKVIYRNLENDEIINDVDDNIILSDEYIESVSPSSEESSSVQNFKSCTSVPIVAVDCGIARLGETESGLIIALRGSIIISNGGIHIKTYRSGPIYLSHEYKKEILFKVGETLGKDDLFVQTREKNGKNEPVEVKSGVADNANQYADRFRNWIERIIQKTAVTSIEDGIILIDGALTLNTRDTPSLFMENLAEKAHKNRNTLIGLSKKSTLLINNRPIQFCLDEKPDCACYKSLTGSIAKQGMERILGNTYAVRFSPLGPTFRMDVKAKNGQADQEAVSQLFCSTLMRGGYPDILVRAHTHSYFTSPDIYQLQAQIGATYSLLPKPEISLTGIFAPFGGRFK